MLDHICALSIIPNTVESLQHLSIDLIMKILPSVHIMSHEKEWYLARKVVQHLLVALAAHEHESNRESRVEVQSGTDHNNNNNNNDSALREGQNGLYGCADEGMVECCRSLVSELTLELDFMENKIHEGGFMSSRW
jgi:hypothetical protein